MILEQHLTFSAVLWKVLDLHICCHGTVILTVELPLQAYSCRLQSSQWSHRKTTTTISNVCYDAVTLRSLSTLIWRPFWIQTAFKRVFTLLLYRLSRFTVNAKQKDASRKCLFVNCIHFLYNTLKKQLTNPTKKSVKER